MYIISDISYMVAESKARELGLKRNEWRYVSSRDIIYDDFRLALRGLRCRPDELIGEFTELEKWYLYKRYDLL